MSRTINARRLKAASAALLLTAGLAHASDLAQIKQKGVLTVAMSGEYPPFSQPSLKGGLEGFDVDVANELGKRLGLKVNVVKTEFPSIIAGIQAGIFDLAVASQSKTPERAKAVDFSAKPYYYDGVQLFAPLSSKATSLASLKGQPVGVALGTIFEKALKDKGHDKIVTYSGEQEGFLALSAGRVQAFLTEKSVGAVAIQKGVKMKPIGPVLLGDETYVTFAKNSPALAAAVNKALDAMRADGTLKKISQKWVGLDLSAPSQ
ncbi:amino acid ABC transporter substrate-binding protein [Deinococcus irradiatisoli]|uniref:Amino acid ABC transporter substrate-binding protein n=1 Tax=Deinococcus irradiatisoli TaxID=2202254 RepID=A0A2Z3JA30_9DEIO|nr:transporter substrate-binding domain-containing protein [Deinococcus irradiatisoli]AWN21967.1 amino acid ABC transporter substrate-binding protein [Deinococcus irradiatisoli]